MLLSDCMRSSSAASRRKPCCLPQRLRPCCSGRCLLPVRSPCAKWTDGKRWQKSQPFNALTLLPEEITSLRWRCRYTDFYQLRDTAGHAIPDLVEILRKVSLEHLQGLTVHSRCTVIGSDRLVRLVHLSLLNLERLVRRICRSHPVSSWFKNTTT